MSEKNTALSDELFSRLCKTAKRDNMTVEKFIDVVCSARDKAIYEHLLKKVSGDEQLAKTLYQSAGGEMPKTDDKRDFAAEYEACRDDFDMFGGFDELPKSVLVQAENENIPLKDAILRYLFEQYKKSQTELENQQKNGQSSLNPPKNSGGENDVLSAMLKGVRQ